MWPLWYVDLTSMVAASLVADGNLATLGVTERRQLGVHELLQAPIRRSDRGGYGSFGAPAPVRAEMTSRRR
jgi:hypothetical protein